MTWNGSVDRLMGSPFVLEFLFRNQSFDMPICRNLCHSAEILEVFPGNNLILAKYFVNSMSISVLDSSVE